MEAFIPVSRMLITAFEQEVTTCEKEYGEGVMGSVEQAGHQGC